jgi:hypothetical protein
MHSYWPNHSRARMRRCTAVAFYCAVIAQAQTDNFCGVGRGLAKAAHPEETLLVVDPFVGGCFETTAIGKSTSASRLHSFRIIWRRWWLFYAVVELTRSFEKAEIFVARDASGLEIVADDEDRDFPVGRDHDGARDALLDVGTMAAFLPCEAETGREKNRFERLPVNRGKLGHTQAQAPTTAKCRSRATHAGLRQEPASCSYPASSNTSSSVP